VATTGEVHVARGEKGERRKRVCRLSEPPFALVDEHKRSPGPGLGEGKEGKPPLSNGGLSASFWKQGEIYRREEEKSRITGQLKVFCGSCRATKKGQGPAIATRRGKRKTYTVPKTRTTSVRNDLLGGRIAQKLSAWEEKKREGERLPAAGDSRSPSRRSRRKLGERGGC